MKNKLLIIMVFVSIFMVGCFNEKTEVVKETEYQKTLENYARNYYESYQKESLKGMINASEVSIEVLKNMNVNGGANYDLSSLSSCKDASTVTLILDEDGEIESVESNMLCE